MPDALDLSPLPPERRAAVAERYWRERAAVRIKEVYPQMLQRFRHDAAYRETARALKQERPQFAFISPRFVQAVMREGR